jgi:hypothetical protein
MYCGRRFILEGFSLVLFAEEEQIKLYAPDGSLVRATKLVEFLQSHSIEETRRAA